jgi:transcriptional regulator with XRE-family HTH domain
MRREFRYGKKIKELRELRAWTQQQLADIAGVEVRTIQRVEKDLTRSPETLHAVAAAFDVTVDSLRSTWLIPESRLLRVRSVSTYKEFIAAEQTHRSDAFAKAIMVPLNDEFHSEVSDLLDQSFTDRDVIEPDEPELWSSYTDFIKQPLERLFDFGFSFFLLDEQRELMLHSSGLLKPERDHMDLKVRHFFLVPTHGCFQLSRTEPLHRFNERCIAAGDALFRTIKEENTGAYVYKNALVAATQPGGESAVQWCDACFPVSPAGTRIGFEYIEQVTGLSRSQVCTLYDETTGEIFLEGLS